jgi:hypothetical protein
MLNIFRFTESLPVFGKKKIKIRIPKYPTMKYKPKEKVTVMGYHMFFKISLIFGRKKVFSKTLKLENNFSFYHFYL